MSGSAAGAIAHKIADAARAEINVALISEFDGDRSHGYVNVEFGVVSSHPLGAFAAESPRPDNNGSASRKDN